MDQSRANNQNLNSSLPNNSQRSAKPSKKKYRCRECMKSFATKQTLREHKYSHTNIRPYQCSSCEKSFRYGSQLSIHKRLHSSEIEIKTLKLTDLSPPLILENQPQVLLMELVRLPPLGVSKSNALHDIFSLSH